MPQLHTLKSSHYLNNFIQQKEKEEEENFCSFHQSPMSNNDNGIDVLVIFTEIVGPERWTGGYNKEREKNYKTCEAAEESAFLGSAQLTVGALSPSLKFWFIIFFLEYSAYTWLW
jgi:hypothetical protein